MEGTTQAARRWIFALALLPALSGPAWADNLAVTNGLSEDVDLTVSTPEGTECGRVVLAPRAGQVFPAADLAARAHALCTGATFLMLRYRVAGAGDETECPSQVRNGGTVTITNADGYPFCVP